MFRKVIVGVDDQQGGRDATALAKHLFAKEPLTLVHVIVRDALIGREAGSEIEAAKHQRAQDLHAGDETQVNGGMRSRVDDDVRCVFAPSVGRGLHELAEAEQADLLVVGSCQRGLVGRVMIGDDTAAALDSVPCALAIAPFGYAERPVALREIGVAYNGSPESQAALDVARAMAAASQTKLSAFEAVSAPAYLTMPGAGLVSEVLPALVRESRARIAALGGVEAHAAYGQASEELEMYSASLDLLVVGSRGHGPIGRLVHGSTSRQLARSARCPLLVIPRGAHVTPQPALEHVGHPTATAIVP